MKRFKSSTPLLKGYTLYFYTSRVETICECAELDYFKKIANHEKIKTLKQAHSSVEHLFKQYIDDVNRLIEKTR